MAPSIAIAQVRIPCKAHAYSTVTNVFGIGTTHHGSDTMYEFLRLSSCAGVELGNGLFQWESR